MSKNCMMLCMDLITWPITPTISASHGQVCVSVKHCVKTRGFIRQMQVFTLETDGKTNKKSSCEQLGPPDILSRVQLRSPVSPLLLSGLLERKMKRSSENELKFYTHKPNIFIRWNKVGALRAPFQSMNHWKLLLIIYLLQKLKSPGIICSIES